MNCDDLTHAEIIRPHCELTRQSCETSSTRLILCDTTEIVFQREIQGIGRVGKGTGYGSFLHTGLMRDATSGKIDGMAGQVLFHRKSKSKCRVHKNSKRRASNRESLAWGQLINEIGSPQSSVKWIHDCDRGADDDEVYCGAFLNGCGWITPGAD